MDFLDGLSDDALKKEATTEARSDTFSSIMKVMRGKGRRGLSPVGHVVVPVGCAVVPVECAVVPVECAVVPVGCAVVPVECAVVPVGCAVDGWGRGGVCRWEGRGGVRREQPGSSVWH